MTGANQPEEMGDMIEVLSEHGFIVERWELDVDYKRDYDGFRIEEMDITYLEDRDVRNE